jgi:ABC-type transport system substrate-binding protein
LQYKAEILDGKEPRFAPFNENDPKAGRAGVLGWEKVQSTTFVYLGWNCRRPLFADKRTRQAMSHAFPKTRIIRETFVGLGQPILADVVVGSRYYNTDLKPYAFDLKKAKELLAAAGWADGDGDGLLDKQVDGKKVDFSFTFKYMANRPEYDNTLTTFKNELRKIGIDLKPLPMEWKELVKAMEDRDFDAVISGWRMGFDVDFYQLWHSSQADVPSGSNHCGFRNARVDELADKLRTTFDTEARVAIAKEIQSIIHDEQPYTFFRAGQGIFVWQNRPAPEAAPEPGRWLDGVVRGLDELPPLTNRSSVYWTIQP